MSEITKFCRDCRHYIPGVAVGQCARTKTTTNLETGELRHGFAETERNYGACGSDAKLFEPKEQDAAA